VKFIAQAKLIQARLPSFDFYLPDRGALIEFQGRQHYEPVAAFGGLMEFRKVMQRDRVKAAWAKQNGYRLITIKYDQNVEEVLARELSGLKKAA
jgi:hypothetical protein